MHPESGGLPCGAWDLELYDVVMDLLTPLFYTLGTRWDLHTDDVSQLSNREMETAPSGSTMLGLRHRRSSIRILQFTEVSQVKIEIKPVTTCGKLLSLS